MKELKAFIFILTILLTGSFTAMAQNNSVAIKTIPGLHTITAKNKINSSVQFLKFTSGIRAILEDSKGNIWFGSDQEGVCFLHNGRQTYYSTANGLSDNQVRNIYEDKNRLIWIETANGISCFDGQQMNIYNERDYDGFRNYWQANGNDLWFKGDMPAGYSPLEGQPGVYQYDGQQLIFRAFPVKPTVGEENYYSVTTPFVKSKDGTFWFGTYGAAIGFKDSKFTIIDNNALGLTLKTGLLHIRSIMEDSKGNLWIGNNGIGVLRYDGNKTINFTEQRKLRKEDTKGNSLEKIFSIGEDAIGNIWFGTYGSGVWRYDGHALVNFTEKDGLPCKQIWRIYKSKKGEMWFGGDEPGGVYVFDGKSFKRKY